MFIQLLAQSACSQPPSIPFGGAHLEQLLATGDQSVQGLGIRSGQRPRFWVDDLSKTSDDLGIQSIGLGQSAGRFGEVTHLARIDHDDGQAGRGQSADQHAFPATSRFTHDQGGT